MSNYGFGADPDAWRVAVAGRVLWEQQQYVESRPPGYPLHEFMVGAVERWGPAATNGISAVSGAIVAALHCYYAAKLGLPFPGLQGLALSAIPAFFVASITSIDYLPALALVLSAHLALRKKRFLLSGCLLGAATAARLTSILFLLPFVAFNRLSVKEILRTSAATILVGLLLRWPQIAVYGLGSFRVSNPGWRGAKQTLFTGVYETFGTVGSIALLSISAVILLKMMFRRSNAYVGSAKRSLLICNHLDLYQALAIILLFSALFMAMPLESGYLIPTLPSLLIVITAFNVGPAVIISLLSLVASPLLEIMPWGISSGALARDLRRRTELNQSVDEFIQRATSSIEEQVVISGEYMSHIEYASRNKVLGRTRFVYSLSRADVRNLQAAGIKVAVLQGVEHVVYTYGGFQPEDENISIWRRPEPE